MKFNSNNRLLFFAAFFSFYSIVYAGTLRLFNASQIRRKSQSTINGNYKDSIDCYLKLGEKFEQSHPDSAWFYFEKAQKLALHNNDKKSLGLFISHAIRLLNDEGKYEKALALGKQMISIGKEINDTTILIKGLNDAANELEYLGDLQQASENYIKALNLSEKVGNYKFQQKLNNNIASVYIELKDYPHANIFATNAFKMAEIINDASDFGSSLINLGISEIHLKKYSSALKHFNHAISISRQVKDVTLEFDAKLNRGIIFTKQKRLQFAWNDYESVHLKSEKLNMPDYDLYALFSLAGIYQLRHNYIKAAELTKQAIVIGKKLNAPNELQEMYDTLSVLSEKLGDPVNALKYRKTYEVLKDSISNAEVRNNINRLQIKYSAAQKNKQIAEQNLRIQENQSTIDKENILLIFSAVLIFILIFLFIIIYRFYRQRKLLHEQSIINFKKEQEVIRLRAIMQGKEAERKRIAGEMHDDIGSSLTTIMYLSNNLNSNDEQLRNKTINKITTTAGFVVDKMNEIIWSMNKEYDTLEDLITYIRYNTVQLFENFNLNYKFIIPSDIPFISLSGENRRNIYLVVKEAVHNIIKHAEATDAEIEFIINGKIKINIIDNGKGFDEKEHSKFGNGLKNMKNRMETIGGTFSITCNARTNITISLPLYDKSIKS